MFTRMWCGKIVVVTDRPRAVNGPLRRQWLKLARKVSRERSSTLQAGRLLPLSNMIARMTSMRLTSTWPDDYEADVFIVTIERLLHWPPDCRTLYVTCDMPLEQLHIITALMPRNGLVVMCKLSQANSETYKS
ncbi:MAG TPA: hypothetical protein VD735_07670 [Candidatus Saccharimonadales bacterium]|nr:hypothetical protein [Candidatus Saccharimonadales bacterium]